jgi:hypothetical protein
MSTLTFHTPHALTFFCFLLYCNMRALKLVHCFLFFVLYFSLPFTAPCTMRTPPSSGAAYSALHEGEYDFIIAGGGINLIFIF